MSLDSGREVVVQCCVRAVYKPVCVVHAPSAVDFLGCEHILEYGWVEAVVTGHIQCHFKQFAEKIISADAVAGERFVADDRA